MATYRGRCQKHRYPSRNSTKMGYDISHRHWRKQVLARDPVCKMCHKAPSTQADHILPIRQGGKRLDPNNGQGLCHSCHSTKTGKEKAKA